MSTPKDNTEIFRLLHDIPQGLKHGLMSNPRSSPFIRRDGYFRSYRQSFANIKTEMDETFLRPTKLSFNVSNDTQLDASGISKCDYSSASTVECHKLKRKLETTEADLLVAHANIKDKEGMISVMEPNYKKARMDVEKSLELCKRQNELDKDKLRELRSQIKFLSDEITDSKNQLIESEKQRKIDNDNLEMKVLSLQLDCSTLKSEVAEVMSEKAEVTRKLNTEIGRLELEIASFNEEAEQSKQYIHSLKRQLNEQTEMATSSCKLQKTLNEYQVKYKELENQLEADKDASLIARTMQGELKLLPELQSENQQLKEELSRHKENNLPLFQEKICSLQDKLNHAEKNYISLIKVQVENEQLREKVSEWETLVDDNEKADGKSPRTFSKKLSHYQRNEILLTNKLSKLTLQCNNLEALNKKLESTIADMKKESSDAQQTIMSMEDMLKRNVRKIHILAKERENSRKLIDSYISESTLGGAGLNIIHIKTLEDTIATYKNSLEKVEEENVILEKKLRQARESKSIEVKDTSEIEKLRSENSQLLSRIEEVQKSNLDLERKLAESQEPVKPDIEKCKVIHLRCNPADEAVRNRLEEYTNLVEEKRSLLEENDKLRKRIVVLEEEGASAEDITRKVQQKLEEGVTVENLNRKLSDAEKKCKTLMDVFRKTSQEFREVVYMLTGYRIDVPLSKKYKLSHMYAESPEEFFIFELSPEGSLDLLQSEYSNKQTEAIETYLNTFESIPAFLSSVTLDLFKRQTCIAGRD